MYVPREEFNFFKNAAIVFMLLFCWLVFLSTFVGIVLLIALFRSSEIQSLMNNVQVQINTVTNLTSIMVERTTRLDQLITDTDSMIVESPNIFHTIKNATTMVESLTTQSYGINKEFLGNTIDIIKWVHEFMVLKPETFSIISDIVDQTEDLINQFIQFKHTFLLENPDLLDKLKQTIEESKNITHQLKIFEEKFLSDGTFQLSFK